MEGSSGQGQGGGGEGGGKKRRRRRRRGGGGGGGPNPQQGEGGQPPQQQARNEGGGGNRPPRQQQPQQQGQPGQPGGGGRDKNRGDRGGRGGKDRGGRDRGGRDREKREEDRGPPMDPRLKAYEKYVPKNEPAFKHEKRRYGLMVFDKLDQAKADLDALRSAAQQFDQLNIVIRAEGGMDDPDLNSLGNVKVFAGTAWALIHDRRKEEGWYEEAR